MSEKHTGGPWQSQHDFDLDGEFTIIGNVDGEIIDGYPHYTYTTVAEIYDNGNLEEDRANARLVAAAPEILEALRFYANPEAWNQPPIKTCEHEIFGPAYENQASKVRLDRGKIARAAIAKALGE